MVRSILSIVFFLPLHIMAQCQLRGVVLKPDGFAVKSTAVQLIKQSPPFLLGSMLTDSSGMFVFIVPDTGTYELKLQSLFYRDTSIVVTISKDDKTILLEPIRLYPLTKTLGSVTVITKKETLEWKDDHIAFTPAADPSIGSRPVSDVLNSIPGISIDAKNVITAKGQENIQLLVNGRIIRTAAGDYLSQLNADEVERIEVYENATRFAYVKAAVVINVILKTKRPKKLWNAAVSANTLPKLNPSVDASFSFGKQRLYARLSHDISNFRSEGYFTREADTTHFYQGFANKTQHQMSTARFGWDYYTDSATTLAVEANFSRHTDGLQAIINVNSPTAQFQNALHSAPIEKEFNGFVSYRKDQKQKGHKMFEIGITRFSLLNQRNLPGLPVSEERHMNNHSVGFKAEWQKNSHKLKILNGVFAQLTQITDHIDTVSLSLMLKSSFRNQALTSYHEASWQQKSWNFSFGVNMDFVRLELDRSEKSAFDYQKVFLNPLLRINYTKGKWRTALSYHRKYILPSVHMLFGPYSQYEYGRVMPGNYRLKPAIQDLIKLSYSTTKKATILVELYYDRTQNPPIMLNRLNGTLITQQPENISNRRSVGGVFSFSHNPLTYYGFTLNIDVRRSDYNFEANTYVLNPVTWAGSSAFINRFTLSKKLSLSLNASLHNWQTTLYRNMNHFFLFALQGSYKISPRMNLSFSLNDLLNDSQFGYEGAIAPGFYESGFAINRMRNIFLSLRYQLINSTLDKKTTTLKSFLSE